MAEGLKILMLEDSSTDAELIKHLLKKNFPDCRITLAMDKQAFLEQLTDETDVILADNSLPSFDAAEALKIARSKFLYIPFIMVTGTVSEEFAAGIIKQGADDYILKDRLIRLPAAIDAALKQRQSEKEIQEAQQELIRSEEKYRMLYQSSPLPIFVFDSETLNFLDVNEAAVNHYGYTREEFLKMYITNIRPPEDVDRFINERARPGSGRQELGLWRHMKKDGSIIVVKIFSHDLIYNGRQARMVLANDLTQRIKSEEEIRAMETEITNQRIQEQKKISRAIIQAQETERNRIGQELHDNVNQILAGTKMYLSMAVKGNEELKKLIRYPMELIDSSINEIRLLSARHVTPLRNIDLRALINNLVDNVINTTPIKIRFTYNLREECMDDDLKLNVFRILQEQANNFIKHGKPDNVRIELSSTSEHLIIMVEDDGKGFDTNAKGNGIGIINTINRVESFNGKMDIRSAPGKGTATTIYIPCSFS